MDLYLKKNAIAPSARTRHDGGVDIDAAKEVWLQARPGLLKIWGCCPVFKLQDLSGPCYQRGFYNASALHIVAFHPGSSKWKPNLETRSRRDSHHAAFHSGLPRWKRIWLPSTLLSQTMLPPRQARWRAAMWNRRRVWWPDGASIHAGTTTAASASRNYCPSIDDSDVPARMNIEFIDNTHR